MTGPLSKGEVIVVILFAAFLTLAVLVFTDVYKPGTIWPHIFRWCKTPACKAGQPCLSFHQLQSFYSIAPSKWTFYSWEVNYRAPKKDLHFGFNAYSDLFKYQKWRTNQITSEKERKKLLEYQKDMSTFSTSIRADIEAYDRKAQEQTKQLILDVQKRTNID